MLFAFFDQHKWLMDLKCVLLLKADKTVEEEGMSTKTGEAINGVYDEAKNFLIIGLTGRTGSGCSTAASKLGAASFDFPAEGYEGLTENELKKHKIIHKYLKGDGWVPFYKLEARSIITYNLLLLDRDLFISYLASIAGAEIQQESAAALYDNFSYVRVELIRLQAFNGRGERSDIESLVELYFTTLPSIAEKFKSDLGGG